MSNIVIQLSLFFWQVLGFENNPDWKESSHRLCVHDCQVPVSLRYVLPENCMMPCPNIPRRLPSDLIHGTIIAKQQVYITSGALCIQLRGYCGAYSHWKFMTVLEIEISILVTLQVCQKALYQ